MPTFLRLSQTSNTGKPRDIKKVPFVELYNGRLQGVVSSGSDIQRVYVSYITAETMDFYCSTNNNRPCGGLGRYPCKHLQELLKEAIKQHGFDEVVHYLKLTAENTPDERSIITQAQNIVKAPAGEVFSRFLAYLQLLEYPDSTTPLPEMDWFN